MPGAEFDIRLYEPEDFDILYEIDQACYPPGIAYSKPMLRWFLRQPGSLTLVATHGHEPIGFIVSESGPPRGHIVTLDVLGAYRRHGIGSALLRETERQLFERGVRRIALETATDNSAAIVFWEKHGYRTFGALKDYYGAGHDARAMQKTLSVPA